MVEDPPTRTLAGLAEHEMRGGWYKFRKLGFIEYNGKIKVNKSLLTVVLHE